MKLFGLLIAFTHGWKIKMCKFIILLTSALIVSFCNFDAQAKVYKWTDSKGNVVYSDIPPELAPEESKTDSPLPTTSNAQQATLLAKNARERLMSASFSPTAWALSKAEIESAQQLDDQNAMVQVALSEVMLKQSYSHGEAFKANSYDTIGLNKALEYAKSAAELAPNDSLSLAQYAKVLLIQNKLDSATDVMRRLHQVDPESYYPWYFLAVMSRKRNHLERMQTSIVEADKYAATRYQQQGLEEERKYLAQKQGDIVAEERSYQKLIQLNPDSAHVHGNYGIFLYRNKRYDEAIKVLNTAISIQPYPMALNFLAKSEQAKNL